MMFRPGTMMVVVMNSRQALGRNFAENGKCSGQYDRELIQPR
jgi:hypothetical protein